MTSCFEQLFEPYDLGSMVLQNRMVMAPMTRHRATADGVPTAAMAEHYAQRGDAGLIVTEGTYPSPMGRGYLFTPGICTGEQIAAWRMVTNAVHHRGARIFCQIMHCGRLSDPLLLPGGADPVAPSAVQPAAEGLYTLNCPRAQRPYLRPREMTTDEVIATIEDYRSATANALAAGFDGVEIHAGNGYLPMQFMATNVNHRTDRFGGSVEGRCRFVIELADAMASVAGADRVGVRLHPGQSFADVFDETPQATLAHLARELGQRGIGYLHLSLRDVGWDVLGVARAGFAGTIIGGAGLSRISAAQAIGQGQFDLAAFGQAFIANPDLVERFRQGWPINLPDPAHFYTQGAQGYLDYPLHGDPAPARQCSPDETFRSVLVAERT